jgi:iron complex outermembrane receptor protein
MAGNYENKYDGKVYNSGFKENDGNLMLGINKNWGHSYFNFSTYNNTFKLLKEKEMLTENLPISMVMEMITADTDYKGYKTGFRIRKLII